MLQGAASPTDAPNRKASSSNEIRQFSRLSPTKRNCSNSLSLVIWGQNLTSLVGSGRLTKQESSLIKFPPFQKGVIIGLLFSDG